MLKKLSEKIESGGFQIRNIVRNTTKVTIPMIAAVFIAIGFGFSFSVSQLIAYASFISLTENGEIKYKDVKKYSDNWRLNENNDWEYYQDGTKVTDAWILEHGRWYLVDNNGTMRTGLFESYGKYYFLDDVRGTGTYGKLLNNGDTFKGITISADTSREYEGALSESTLNSLNNMGYSRSSAKSVTGTQQAVNRIAGYTLPSGFSLRNDVKVYEAEGFKLVSGIYSEEDFHRYTIGIDGVMFQGDVFGRNFKGVTDFMHYYGQYLNTGKPAPDGNIYVTADRVPEDYRIEDDLRPGDIYAIDSIFASQRGERGTRLNTYRKHLDRGEISETQTYNLNN